jgi:benzoyl-CoA-dihydrodiol lyase
MSRIFMADIMIISTRGEAMPSCRKFVIPGRAARREPGIQVVTARSSGFRVRVLRTRPGMTRQGSAARPCARDGKAMDERTTTKNNADDAPAGPKLAGGMTRIDFATEPARYRHWKLAVEGGIATLTLDVAEKGGLFEGYDLKLNSYDLGVDIELADAFERIRFEHPQVHAVVLRSGKPRVFCAGANIRMLAGASHAHKVNFCKFTNETRNAIEDASAASGLRTVCIINGTAAGGGYELALATDHIILTDDGSAAVSLPEVPLLAVLPGTGGLTRLVDKRKVRRDRADVFCTTEEGIKGRRAVEWRLVDEIVPPSRLEAAVAARARQFAEASPTGGGKHENSERGIALTPLERSIGPDRCDYGSVAVTFDRPARLANILLRGPLMPPPATANDMMSAGAAFWPLRLARELDDAILDIRLNEFDVAGIVFRSEGDLEAVQAYDQFLDAHRTHWLAREIRLKWKRVLKRIDLTARSLVALVEPGSCFAGTLAEIVFAADRSYMLAGGRNGDNRAATLMLDTVNFGALAMSNGLSRLATRFLGEPQSLAASQAAIGEALGADAAEALGLITFARDEIDWEDEIRLFLEERASFSPDALTGLEANLRFAGPETMETKIFARLSAWQNWIFQRPNATGETGALKRYGSGRKPRFDTTRT